MGPTPTGVMSLLTAAVAAYVVASIALRGLAEARRNRIRAVPETEDTPMVTATETTGYTYCDQQKPCIHREETSCPD